MIYLIGGPARDGKSTLAKRFRKQTDGYVLAGDAFVDSLHQNLHAEWLPDLFEHTNNPIEQISNAREKLDRLRRRDKAVWPFYDSYIKKAVADAPHDDVLIEGNIWPDYLGSLELAHRAVFLVDTSPDQAKRLMAIRDGDGDNDWMHDFSDEKIAHWAKFNAMRSELYVEYCRQYDYPFFDIAEHGIEKAEQLAFEYLLAKEV